MRMVRNKGLSLLEILVATMILAIVMAGLANLFVSSKWHIMRTRSLIVVGELARYFLDPLQGNVSGDNWDSKISCLYSKNCTSQVLQNTQLTPGNFSYNYTVSYNITNVTSVNNLTKVVLTINWTNETVP